MRRRRSDQTPGSGQEQRAWHCGMQTVSDVLTSMALAFHSERLFVAAGAHAGAHAGWGVGGMSRHEQWHGHTRRRKLLKTVGADPAKRNLSTRFRWSAAGERMNGRSQVRDHCESWRRRFCSALRGLSMLPSIG